ncbi:MAG TPA: SAM-dependent chlorinase/fluorinase [Tepidiformaceae bacterium]|nr:SAM-dependent chlorinase/fluorinase [Tepidiformaceae bacterium]
MEKLSRPVFLLTDFSLHDHYVGQVRAVIASISPRSPVHDLAHDVEPFAIDEAAWLLETSMAVLPEDAVVMAVVDPGVGTGRRPLVAQQGGRTFVGPDNGILSGMLSDETRDTSTRRGPRARIAGLPELDVRELTDPGLMRPRVSNTFHARDVFAPAAAYIAAGTDYRMAGAPIAEMVALAPFCGRPAEMGRLAGEVVHIDRYGNLMTTIRGAQIFPSFVLEVGTHEVDTHVHTFAEVPPGRPFCHIDSSGFLAVAMNKGNAARELGVARGARVSVRAR